MPGADVEDRGGIALIRLGPANIWDFGDLTRIREAASRAFARGARRVGVDLSHVGLLPSGFMNMLCGWQERGADVYLFSPRPNVREMFWFQKFTEPAGEGVWRMTCLPPEQTWPETLRIDPAAECGMTERRFVASGRAGDGVADRRQFDDLEG